MSDLRFASFAPTLVIATTSWLLVANASAAGTDSTTTQAARPADELAVVQPEPKHVSPPTPPVHEEIVDTSCELFLRDDGSFDWKDPTDLLDPTASVDPVVDPMFPPDLDDDGEPGLTIKKNPDLDKPKQFQEWIAEPQLDDVCLSGLSRVHLWMVLDMFTDDKAGTVTVMLLDRDDDDMDQLVGQASLVLDPLSFNGTWDQKVFLFAPNETDTDDETGFPYYTLEADHRLVLQVIVGGNLSARDVWFTYDSTDYPSKVFFKSCDCDNIQPPVESDGDWVISGSDLFSAVPGNVGIGVEEPASKLHIDGGTDVFVGDGGYLTIGPTDGLNLAADKSGIMARNDGGTFTLHLQADGGRILVHARKPASERFVVQDDGDVGIGTGFPTRKLEVQGDGYFAQLVTIANSILLNPFAGGGGAAAIFRNSGGIDTIVLDADEADSAAVRLRDQLGTTTIELDAAGAGGGAGIILKNQAGVNTIVLDADDDADGAELRMRNGAGQTTIDLDASEGNSAVVRLRDDSGTTTIELDAEGASGGAGIILKNQAGVNTIVIDADDDNNSPEIRLRNSSGTVTVKLDASHNGGKGRVTADVVEITGGADLSELFDVTGQAIPGTVVSIDPSNPGKLTVSGRAYDRAVAGIISGANGVDPGVLLRQRGTAADGALPVALTGRVYCRADSSNGEIEPGDMLTSSREQGRCMKVTDFDRARGAVIGKAMSRIEHGMVLVLVNLQ